MNKKMQCLALPARCGSRAVERASPRAAADDPAKARVAKKPSRESRSISASPAKPPPTSHKNSRRVRRHGVEFGMNRSVRLSIKSRSVRIHELIQVEDRPADEFQRAPLVGGWRA